LEQLKMYKGASGNMQRALAGPTYKYSVRKVAKKLPPKGSDKDQRTPRSYKAEAAAKGARGRGQPPEARMKGVIVKKIVRDSEGRKRFVTVKP
jgi:hypothetical protein